MVSMVIVPLYFSHLEFRGAYTSVYSQHQLLWRAFDHDSRPFLYRADIVHAERPPRLHMLVQSVAKPEWSKLDDDLLRAEERQVDVRLAVGKELRFFLRANPTVARKGRNEPAFAALSAQEFRARRGRRVALVGDDERLDWLKRTGLRNGFAVQAVRTSNLQVQRWERNGNAARHDGVDFEGVLVIKDPAQMATGLARGLGSAKAFGFGLMSLATRQ